jgi:ATP adenylyltransferase
MSEGAYEPWLKQLEFLQAIIARLAGYGATLKNYCLTIVTATVGLTISFKRPEILLVALLPIVGFALLDIEYLRTERRFRELFNVLRQETARNAPTFDMDPKQVPEVEWFTTRQTFPAGLAARHCD